MITVGVAESERCDDEIFKRLARVEEQVANAVRLLLAHQELMDTHHKLILDLARLAGVHQDFVLKLKNDGVIQ